jgi:hypothetical protein
MARAEECVVRADAAAEEEAAAASLRDGPAPPAMLGAGPHTPGRTALSAHDTTTAAAHQCGRGTSRPYRPASWRPCRVCDNNNETVFMTSRLWRPRRCCRRGLLIDAAAAACCASKTGTCTRVVRRAAVRRKIKQEQSKVKLHFYLHDLQI